MSSTPRWRHLSLKGALVLLLVASALLPTYFTSLYLIERFQTVAGQSAEQSLSLTANVLAQDVARSYRLLEQSLSYLGQDADVIYATQSSAFGAKAKAKMEKLAQDHPSIGGIYLVDQSLWPVQMTPITLDLLPLEPLQARLKEFLASQPKQSQLITYHNVDYVRQLNQLKNESSQEQLSDAVFLFLTPLWLADRTSSELVGALITLLPVEALYGEIQQTLASAGRGKTQVLNIKSQQDALLRSLETNESSNYFLAEFQLYQDNTLPDIGITIGLDKQEAMASIDSLFFESWLIALSLGSLFAVLALLMSRWLVRPLLQLTHVVEGFSRGELATKAPRLFFLELHQIGVVLEQMAERIQQDQLQLENRVEARTLELSKANQELEQTMAELRETQAHLIESEKMSQLGHLVAGVAHEINTPVGVAITAITSLPVELEQLETKIRNNQLTRSALFQHIEVTQQYADLVLDNLQRASELVNTFKEVAADQNTEQFRSFAVGHYIASVISSLEPKYKGKPIHFEVLGEPALKIDSYPGVLGQILTYLIINAIHHGQVGRNPLHIKIHYQTQGEQFTLRFEDDGVGVNEQDLAQLFEPFFTTKRDQGGTGLGLHIVYNLVVQKLGGSIKAQSAKDQGLSFEIQFPVNQGCD